MKNAFSLLLISALLSAAPAFAEDAATPAPSDATTTAAPGKAKKPKRKRKKAAAAKAKAEAKKEEVKQDALANPDAVPAHSVSDGGGAAGLSATPPSLKAANLADKAENDEIKNNRMKAAEGSKSPYSGQFSIGYNGSSLNHPFSEFAPNAIGSSQANLVTMSGSFSARYRADKHTTMGLGVGVVTQTPFQGPKNTTVLNPYYDIARSFKLGPLQNRSDVTITMVTDQQGHDQYGQVVSFGYSNEAFYEFPFGLTTGLAFSADYGIFKGGAQYGAPSVLGGQTNYDFTFSPYFEYALSKKVSLRSVINVGFEHNRLLKGTEFRGLKVNQTLGVAIAAADSIFVYPYIRGTPYTPNQGNIRFTTLGFSMIVNLF